MRKIIYAQNVSIDGFIEDVDGNIDWTNPGEELHRHFNEREKCFDTHFYGRNVHDIMNAWTTMEDKPNVPDYMREYARMWNKVNKVVFSTTLKKTKYKAQLLREINPEEIMKLKKQRGKNIFLGGAGLAESFMKVSLIDEFWLYIYPLILGGGKHVIPQLKKRIQLSRIGSKSFENGVMLLKYELKTYN